MLEFSFLFGLPISSFKALAETLLAGHLDSTWFCSSNLLMLQSASLTMSGGGPIRHRLDGLLTACVVRTDFSAKRFLLPYGGVPIFDRRLKVSVVAV